MHDMPDWWQELAEISKVDDHWGLAQKIQASFKLPWQISKLHGVENYHQAPPALLCLHWKNFLPQQDSISPAGTSGSQLEKMVAYAWALQFWVEKANLPTLGQPTMPFGRKCLGIKGGNEMLHFLPQQLHLWWHDPARRIPDRPARDNCSWE